MERVLKPNWLTPLVLFVCLLGWAQSSSATTAIVPPDDDLIIGARVIVKGKILSIESSFDEQQGRIFTYIKLKVQEVLKGQITERNIVIKELGGRVGDRLSVVYGNPEFALGEQVLVYLDTWKDGSLRTYQMFLGKFSIVKDEKTGREFAVRGTGDEHVVVLPTHNGKQSGAITDRMEVSAYIAMVKSRLAANVKQSQRFEQTYYSDVPTLASPPGYLSGSKNGDIHPEFALFNPPSRWFEPDTGQPVTYTLNPNPSGDPSIPPLVVDPADIAAAANSWSTVQGCALHVQFAGNLEDCYTSNGSPGINVVSNNCDGRNSPTTGCAGILAWGGWSGGFYSPIVINGTTFQYRITQGFVSCNPWAACNFSDHCSVQFIVTHEMGHALGLGHSQYQQATMYAIAYYIARCAVLWTDDQDAIKFVYPGAGGGPGPLSITTTSLPNGTVGSSYSQSVFASGGTAPYSWSLVQGQGTLPPGLSMSAAGAITGAPTTAGTYNFTVKVTDNVAATAQKALGIVVASAGGGGALNSQFVSQSVPTSVQPGQSFAANLKFLNTGTQTWSGTAYYFASQNPALNQTWGGNGVSLAGFAAGPGGVLDVTFTATAPTTPGTYNFQWQMYENGGVGFFGQVSTNVVVNVGVQPEYHGNHEIADCSRISGWAWDANQPNAATNVDIYNGTTLIATVAANQFRQDLLSAGMGDGSHAFSFAVPASLRDGQAHSIRVKFAGTSTDLGNTPKTITCTSAAYGGNHEVADCSRISGWAWDANQPNVAINVDIYDGATLIATVAANQFRQDLMNAGMGNGLHAFSFAVPASLRDGQAHSIRVKFAGTSTDLGNTAKTITCTSAAYGGNHEVADCSRISGWAWDATQPNAAINVDIYDGATLIDTVAANQFRQDLLNAGMGNGSHAFSFTVPASLKDGLPHLIRVRFSGTVSDLGNTPKTITCSP